jgi:hypothetical protein
MTAFVAVRRWLGGLVLSGWRSGVFGGLASAGLGEPVGVGAGVVDGGVEGEPVNDGGTKAGFGEGLGPAIWGWLMFVLSDSRCLLGTCCLVILR